MSGRLALKQAAVVRPVSNEEVQAGAVRALQHGVGTGVAVTLAGVPPSPLQAVAAADAVTGGAAPTDASPAVAQPGSSSRKRKAEKPPPAAAVRPTPASGRRQRASTQKKRMEEDDALEWSSDEEASEGVSSSSAGYSACLGMPAALQPEHAADPTHPGLVGAANFVPQHVNSCQHC